MKIIPIITLSLLIAITGCKKKEVPNELQHSEFQLYSTLPGDYLTEVVAELTGTDIIDLGNIYHTTNGWFEDLDYENLTPENFHGFVQNTMVYTKNINGRIDISIEIDYSKKYQLEEIEKNLNVSPLHKGKEYYGIYIKTAYTPNENIKTDCSKYSSNQCIQRDRIGIQIRKKPKNNLHKSIT